LKLKLKISPQRRKGAKIAKKNLMEFANSIPLRLCAFAVKDF
jgi:hypothetical protein